MVDSSHAAAAEAGPGEESVRRTAALARLEITDAEATRLGPQFARILDAFRVLETLDVEGAGAMTRVGSDDAVTRPDEPRASLPVDDVLRAAPERIDDFYGVPKTVARPDASGSGGTR